MNALTNAMNFDWNSPHAAAQAVYQLRQHDAGDELLEAATLAAVMDSIAAAGGTWGTELGTEFAAVFDALLVSSGKLTAKAKQMGMALSRAAGTVQLVEQGVTVTQPFKQNGSTQVCMMFEMSDGQTITVYLHNPDVKPNQLQADDVLVSWKWLLNRKDITIVVAPEQGRDLALTQVAARIMALVEKNSARFTKANASRQARVERVAGLEQAVQTKEATLSELLTQIEQQKTTPPPPAVAPVSPDAAPPPASPSESSPASPVPDHWYEQASIPERQALIGLSLQRLGWQYDAQTECAQLAYQQADRAGDLNPSASFTLQATVDEATGRWLELFKGFEVIGLSEGFDLRGLRPDTVDALTARFDAQARAWVVSQGGTFETAITAAPVGASVETPMAEVEAERADSAMPAPQAEDLGSVEGIAKAMQNRFAQREYAYNRTAVQENNTGGLSLAQMDARVTESLHRPPLAAYLETAQQIVDKDYMALIGKFVHGIFGSTERLFKDITRVKVYGLSRKDKTAALLTWGGVDAAGVTAYFKAQIDAEAAHEAAEVEAKQAAQADKQAQWSKEYAGFLDGLSPMAAGKAIAALSKVFRWRDQEGLVHTETYKQFADNAIYGGDEVRTVNRGARNEQGYKVERALAHFYESQLNATVMNYAIHLKQHLPEPVALEVETEVETPAEPSVEVTAAVPESGPASEITSEAAPEPAAASDNPIATFLNGIIAGTEDLQAEGFAERLTAMHAATTEDAHLSALFTQAVDVYAAAAMQQAQLALVQ